MKRFTKKNLLLGIIFLAALLSFAIIIINAQTRDETHQITALERMSIRLNRIKSILEELPESEAELVESDFEKSNHITLRNIAHNLNNIELSIYVDDIWGVSMLCVKNDKGYYFVQSAGQDMKFGTDDDLEIMLDKMGHAAGGEEKKP